MLVKLIKGKLDWVIIVDFPDNDPRLKDKSVGGRDIWLYEGDIQLENEPGIYTFFAQSN
jgi:hypothetical protein